MENLRSKLELAGSLGEEFGKGLREASGYDDTQREFEKKGLTENVLNKTPPIGVNLGILSEMPGVLRLREEWAGRSIRAGILGLSIIDGVVDFQRFVNSAIGANIETLYVVEIDPEMINQVRSLEDPIVVPLLRDARDTGIDDNNLDIILRDHIGNCCPPEIDRAINLEVARVLRPGGISFVNITTSELIRQSPNRMFIPFNKLREDLEDSTLARLQTEVYDLEQLGRMIGRERAEQLRGSLLEIEPHFSFVIFGEDSIGHGEWFRPLVQHLQGWEQYGFHAIDSKTRDGNDSHEPPLRCLRHNFVLAKE